MEGFPVVDGRLVVDAALTKVVGLLVGLIKVVGFPVEVGFKLLALKVDLLGDGLDGERGAGAAKTSWSWKEQAASCKTREEIRM